MATQITPAMPGGPFTDGLKREIIDYCFDDVLALSRLLPSVVKTIRSLPHAMLRASYQWAAACQEQRGVPIDLPTLERLRANWQPLRLRLVQELDGPFGIYDVVDGAPHWRSHKFAEFVTRNGLTWPRLGSGALDESSETFRDMVARYPAIEPLKELRSSLAQLRLNSLAVGHDGRNRTQFWAFSTKTGRNAPRASRFVFGPAKWLRFLVSPPSSLAITHRDYCQQEVQIAAIVSGDNELLAACASGDVYLGVAKQLGFAPNDATPETHGEVRSLFKTVVLGISYGLGPGSLSERTGVSLVEAREILARMRARFHRFEDYMASVSDQAGLDLELTTAFGWRMICPPEINPRTVRNFPMQSAGAEILRVASILAERRGIRVLAPVHDALMAEGAEDQIEDVSAALDRVMLDASAVVLQGYELRTDEQIVRPGQRFFDKRGASMWETVSSLLDDLERCNG
jgi:DNA polymerase-1